MAAYWGIAAQSAVPMVYVPMCHFSFFPPLGLWSGCFFLIAPFPEHCLLVPLYISNQKLYMSIFQSYIHMFKQSKNFTTPAEIRQALNSHVRRI